MGTLLWAGFGLLFLVLGLSYVVFTAVSKKYYSIFIILCFVLSGGSGLIFETIWTRMLSLVFGSTALAISSVLTAFMGGLALGSYISGRYADKIKNPIMWYAIAEGGIGICGFIIPWVVNHIYPQINIWLWASWGPGYFTFSLLRFVFVGLLLLVPTTLMGATLPFLVKHFVAKPAWMKKVGLNVGTLYTLNTLGGVIGTFVAGFVFLPNVGLHATNIIAACNNLFLFALIFYLKDKLQTERQESDEALTQKPGILSILVGIFVLAFAFVTLHPSIAINAAFYILFVILLIVTGLFLIFIGYLKMKNAEEANEKSAGTTVEAYPISKYAKYMAIITFAFSGLASMNYQVIWNRALAMVLGSSVYSFTLILLAFLIGIAIGSAVYSSFMNRIKNPVFHLSIIQILIAWMAILNFWYMDKLPFWFAKIVTSHIEHYHEHVGTVQFFMFLIASLSILPVTLGMGASFPLIVKIWTSGHESLGRDVGSLYAWNTIGCIVGSFASSFIFVPTFSAMRYKLTGFSHGYGMQDAFFLSVAINFILGLLLLFGVHKVKKWLYVHYALIVLTLIWMFGTIGLVPRWNLAHMTLGTFRLSIAGNVREDQPEPDLVFYYDGISTTVSVEKWGNHFALKNNGKVDASNGDDIPTQIMVAGYPLLFHPRGPNNLELADIGFGSGMTIGTATRFPIKSFDVIELEPSISGPPTGIGTSRNDRIRYRRDRAGARWFMEINHDPWSNWRVRINNNDGRNFLASTPKKYDIIISEPSNPWITGVSNLFTVDHFKNAVRSLKPDGIFCQWVQLYELSPENIKAVYRTIAAVFPYVMVFAADDWSSDTAVVASFQPISLDLDRIRRSMESSPSAKRELERAYIYSPYDVLGRVILANRQEVLHYTSEPMVNGECPDGTEEQLEPACENCPTLGVCQDMSKSCTNDDECGDNGRCYTCGIELNTDDNARIEFNAPEDLIGFERFERYVSTFYDVAWPYARLCDDLQPGRCNVTGYGEGDVAANNFAEIALAMMAHGRFDRAPHFLQLSEKLGQSALRPMVEKIGQLVRGEEIEPIPQFGSPTLGSNVNPQMVEMISTKYNEIITDIEQGKWGMALQKFNEIPQEVRLQSGPDMLYLYGYLLYRNSSPRENPLYRESSQVLRELIRMEPDYANLHPDIYYYLGRCYYNMFEFTDSVRYMRNYVETTLGAAPEQQNAIQPTEAAQQPENAGLVQQNEEENNNAPAQPDTQENQQGQQQGNLRNLEQYNE